MLQEHLLGEAIPQREVGGTVCLVDLIAQTAGTTEENGLKT
jgi:hypothetical protein